MVLAIDDGGILRSWGSGQTASSNTQDADQKMILPEEKKSKDWQA